ncbi:site-specific DNA-methyltransferase [Micromonospora sp. Llam0]|uniref:DNA-methyltransferase n=1 Tax=Micromonospora sp. Llam0 TaxID=2485143 RepID=UPI00210853F9|nr:site-specific DNA-methyltransferase [Micromonospora sp. Llam0]
MPHPLGRTRRTHGTHGTTCPACQARWVDPQYGLEATLDDYLDHLVAVFDQARRVLAPTGTCWVNLGGSYSSAAAGAPKAGRPQPGRMRPARPRVQDTLPPKNLVGVPWRVAFALQADGWWLRNAIIWAKSNPMPEFVGDRLSTSYELLFLLTRSHSYYFNLDPIRIPLVRPETADGTRIIGRSRKGRTSGVDATARLLGATAAPRRSGSSLGKGAATSSRSVTPTPPPIRRDATQGCLADRDPPLPRVPRGAIPDRPAAAGDRGQLPARRCGVLDPFSGAGTTGLAALQLGRRYRGVDINAGFHDEALTRLRPHLPDDTASEDGG